MLQSSNRKRILITDNLHDAGLEVLRSRSDLFELDVRKSVTHDELVGIIGQYDGAIIHVATKLTEAVLKAAVPRLRFVGCASVGFDHVDTAAAQKLGIHVESAAGANADSVGDLALALMLSMARRLPECRDNLASDGWDRKAINGFALKEKTLGILGIGHTGRATAIRAKACGMRVVAFDPKFAMGTQVTGVDVMLGNQAEVLRVADVLSVHVPLQHDTLRLIAASELAALKPGSYVINTARGGIVAEDDMRAALDSGHIAGYGVDVFEVEPLPKGYWIRKHSKVVATLHLGGATGSAREAVARCIADHAVSFFSR